MIPSGKIQKIRLKVFLFLKGNVHQPRVSGCLCWESSTCFTDTRSRRCWWCYQELTTLLWQFFVTVRRMQGCLLELRGRGVMGLSRYLKTMSCRNLTTLCSAPHSSLDQPLLPQGPTWRIEHCLHTAPQYNCYLFIHLKSAALLLFPAPRSCVCRMPSPGWVFSEVIS